MVTRVTITALALELTIRTLRKGWSADYSSPAVQLVIL